MSKQNIFDFLEDANENEIETLERMTPEFSEEQFERILKMSVAKKESIRKEKEKKQDTDSVEVSEVRVHKFSIWKRFLSVAVLFVFIVGYLVTKVVLVKNSPIQLSTADIMYSADDYLLQAVELEEYITTISDVRYNENTGNFDIYGNIRGAGACVCLKNGGNFDEFEILGEHANEPFLYHNGEFYGGGLNLNGSQDNIFPESAEVKSICVDDNGYEYRLLEVNGFQDMLDVRNKENDVRYFGKISDIDGLKEYISYTGEQQSVLKTIKVYDEKIYIGGFLVDAIDNNKYYSPFIIVLSSKDFTLVDVITEIDDDIKMLEDILINENGEIIAVYYDSETAVYYDSETTSAYVCDVVRNNTVEIEYCQKVISYAENSFVYADDIGRIYEYDFEENESILIDEISELKDKDNDTLMTMLSYDSNGYAYVLFYNNILKNTAISYSEDGAVGESKNTDDVFILKKENKVYHAVNYTGDKKIIFENEDYTNIKSMDFDEEYFYLSDENMLYVYDYDGKLHFQKKIKNTTGIKLFGNSKQHYVATVDNKNKWKISSVNTEEKEISEECTVNINKNAEFIDGDNNYDFYIFADEILYGYRGNKELVPLIDLSSYALSGEIKGINISNEKIEIVTSYGISILKPRDTKVSEHKTIKILVPPASYKYSEILKRYKSENGNIDFIIDYPDSYDITEKMPDIDIVIANDYIDITGLMEQGVFEDIYKYISDNDLILPEYTDNIVNAYSDDYAFPLTFDIKGVDIISDSVIDKKTFCLNDLKLLVENGDYSIGYVPSIFLLDNNKRFIDYDKHSVDFENDDFISILEIMEKCPYLNLEHSIYESSLSYKSATENLRFGDDFNFIGVPSSSGNDYYVHSDDLFMICKNSENKDICFDILKFLLGEEVQETITDNRWKFPVNRSLYQKYMNELAWSTDEEYTKEVMDIIENTHNVYIANNKVKHILQEEILKFESKAQNANETAESVQKRVKVDIINTTNS